MPLASLPQPGNPHAAGTILNAAALDDLEEMEAIAQERERTRSDREHREAVARLIFGGAR